MSYKNENKQNKSYRWVSTNKLLTFNYDKGVSLNFFGTRPFYNLTNVKITTNSNLLTYKTTVLTNNLSLILLIIMRYFVYSLLGYFFYITISAILYSTGIVIFDITNSLNNSNNYCIKTDQTINTYTNTTITTNCVNISCIYNLFLLFRLF